MNSDTLLRALVEDAFDDSPATAKVASVAKPAPTGQVKIATGLTAVAALFIRETQASSERRGDRQGRLRGVLKGHYRDLAAAGSARRKNCANSPACRRPVSVNSASSLRPAFEPVWSHSKLLADWPWRIK